MIFMKTKFFIGLIILTAAVFSACAGGAEGFRVVNTTAENVAVRGFDAVSSSPEELAQFLDKDYVKFRDLIQRLGLQVE